MIKTTHEIQIKLEAPSYTLNNGYKFREQAYWWPIDEEDVVGWKVVKEDKFSNFYVLVKTQVYENIMLDKEVQRLIPFLKPKIEREEFIQLTDEKREVWIHERNIKFITETVSDCRN